MYHRFRGKNQNLIFKMIYVHHTFYNKFTLSLQWECVDFKLSLLCYRLKRKERIQRWTTSLLEITKLQIIFL